MGRAGVLSHRIKLLPGRDPASLFIEVVLEKHIHSEAGGSISICRPVITG